MDPVTRALQTIAAIQSETREQPQAASRCPTEQLRSQNLSVSSPASSNDRERTTALSATTTGTANLNRRSGAPPIAQVVRDREIRIDKRDRFVVASAGDVTRRGVTIIIGALLLALAICLGWIRGLNWDSFFIKAASLSVEKATSSDASAKSEQLTSQSSSANTHAHETSKRRTQTSESSLTKQVPAVE